MILHLKSPNVICINQQSDLLMYSSGLFQRHIVSHIKMEGTPPPPVTSKQLNIDGWVSVLRPFDSISVISRRWKGEHERLCAMKRRLGSGRISPPAGFEPVTPWSEVGSANRSATRTQLNIPNTNCFPQRFLLCSKMEHFFSSFFFYLFRRIDALLQGFLVLLRSILSEPDHEKTRLRGFWPVKIQSGLLSYRC